MGTLVGLHVVPCGPGIRSYHSCYNSLAGGVKRRNRSKERGRSGSRKDKVGRKEHIVDMAYITYYQDAKSELTGITIIVGSRVNLVICTGTLGYLVETDRTYSLHHYQGYSRGPPLRGS